MQVRANGEVELVRRIRPQSSLCPLTFNHYSLLVLVCFFDFFCGPIYEASTPPHLTLCAAFLRVLPVLGLNSSDALLFDVRLELILSYLIAPGYVSITALSNGNAISTLNPDGYNITARVK